MSRCVNEEPTPRYWKVAPPSREMAMRLPAGTEVIAYWTCSRELSGS
ncbi:Uncharacterised protein [Xylophilus ampelinus]|nr:Uncharacterised protein [Xylophilus ampelinus]